MKFRVASLLVVTAALAVTLAIGLSPLPELAPWEVDMRWQQALLCGGAVLLIYELARQAMLLSRENEVAGPPFKFAFLAAVAIRLLLASLVAAAIAARLLVSRGMNTQIDRVDWPNVYVEIWPDLMMTISMLFAVRTLLVPRGEINGSPIRKLLSGSVIIVGSLSILCFMLSDRAENAALAHYATNTVERGHPISLQRAAVFPNHLQEGFQAFWMSATVALAMLFAAGLLCIHAATILPWLRTLASIALPPILLIAGTYCWWFACKEFPRISPDLASVDTPRSWSDTLTGIVLLVGLTALLGWRLAQTQVKKQGILLNLPPASSTKTLAVCLVTVASGWQANVLLCQWTIEDSPRSLLSFLFWFLPWPGWISWQNYVYTFTEAILQPEVLLTLMLFVSTLSLLSKTVRQPSTSVALHPVDVTHLSAYSLAAFALMIVFVPSLAIFSFCYWLSPFLL